ncbi:MAG: PAS domain S-box protein, partial [Firmicutes bacterium]|nr:PAS domain S-box protein [Bacillota bacterium]
MEGLGKPVLSLEEWLFPNTRLLGAILTGRMSPATAALLFFSGAVFPMLFLRERNRVHQNFFRDLAGGLGVLVTMVGAVFVLSYLHGAPILYGTAAIPMAATTAIAFLLLGTGQVLAVGPDGFPSRLFAGPSTRARLLRVFVSTTVGVVAAIDLLHVYAHRFFFDGSAFISGFSTAAFLVMAGTLIARVALKVGDDMDRSEEVRRGVEEALKSSLSLLSASLESTADGILIVDRKGKIVRWNRKFAEMWKIPNEILSSRDDREAINYILAQLADPEQFAAKVGELYEQPEKSSFDQFEFTDGRFFERYSQPQSVEGTIVGRVWSFRDITERKRAEEGIRSLAKFPSENPDPIMRIAMDGTLLYINEIGSRHLSDWQLQAGRIVPPMLRDTVSRAMNLGSRQVFELEHNESVYSFTVAPISDAGYANLYGRNITEHKRAEWALKESEEKFRIIFDCSKDGIILADIESKKIYTGNKTFCDMLQYTHDEIMQLCVADIHPEENLPRLLDAYERGGRQESVLEGDIPVQRKDGSVFWTEITAIPVTISGKKYLLGNFRDVTDRRKANEAVTRLGLAVDQTAEAIVITDTKGTIQYVNPAFERSTGYSREEAVGKNPGVLRSGKHDEAFYRGLWDTLTRGDVWTGHFINQKKDGSLFEEDATISPLRDSSGKIVNYVASKRDVTEMVSLERQVRTAQKMEAVGTLAGGIAHDFNNALTGIVGFGELLRMRLAGDEQSLHDLDEILRCAERAATLTRQLLTFARRQVIDPVNMDLSALVADLMKLIGKVVGEHIEVKTSLNKNVPTIFADRGQIEQVVMNLCLNARDAMPEAGRLLVETEDVYLEEEYVRQNPYMKTGRYALLTVSDTGVGMDEKTRERVFEPFFSTKGPDKGTGLGLAMVYGIVKQHGGFIHLYSEPGKGTAFKVYFPAVEAQPDAVPAKRGEEILRGGKETILLAEDEEAIRALAERILTGFGYTVLAARNGEEAVEIFRRHKEIDLAVLDVVMPRKGG